VQLRAAWLLACPSAEHVRTLCKAPEGRARRGWPCRGAAATCRHRRRLLTRPPPLPAELKQLLYALFGQFGKIVDIVTMRTDRLRGQVRLQLPHRAVVRFARQLCSQRRLGERGVGCTRLCAPPTDPAGSNLPALQAWVVFADIGAATSALRGMQNFPFFDKPMVSWRAACLPLGAWASLLHGNMQQQLLPWP
jgi:hypothetical protein